MRSFFVIFFVTSAFIICSNVDAQSYFVENHTWQVNLTGVTYPSLAFGDVDNDMDNDLILSGCNYIASGFICSTPITKIYINNGSSFVENFIWEQNLTPISRGSLAWGDIDNNGYLDLVLAGCGSGGGYSAECNTYIMKIYINNGTSLLENFTWEQNFVGIDFYSGSIALGDINNDGLLDLALAGASSAGNNGIYVNNGTTFSKSNVCFGNLPYMGQQMGGASLLLGDLDNDSKLDLIATGSSSTNFYALIYINNGTALLENSTWEQNLGSALGFPSIALGDYDNDSSLDLVYIGARAGDHIKFFNNSGSTFMLNQENLPANNLIGILDGAVAWGDYDNDGYLDLAANGRETYTDIYSNQHGIFDRNTTIGDILMDLRFSSIVWGDIDNDGDLDLIESGDKDGTFYTKVYTSNFSSNKKNEQPNVPTTGFDNSYDNEKLYLSWNTGSDAETPTLGLYYNLRAGTCPGCHDVISGVYGGSSNPIAGYFGNMMQRRSITLNRHFEPGTKIYWAVQTIDTGLAKSAWSTEQVYTIPGACEPSWSCSSWGSCQPDSTQACSSWNDSNGCGVPYSGSNTRGCSYSRPGSSGGPSYVPPSNQHTFDVIVPGNPASKKFAEGVNVTINVKETTRNVDISVNFIANKPPSVSRNVMGKVYSYLEINSSGINDSGIMEASIGFRVGRNWTIQNNIDKGSIALNRYHDNEWGKLETSLVAMDDAYYQYRAISPGFSYFAISGEEIAANGVPDNETTPGNQTPPARICTPESKRCSGGEVEECDSLGAVWVAREVCANGCDSTGMACNPAVASGYTIYLFAISAMATATLAAVCLMKRKSRKPKTLEEVSGGCPPAS